MCGTKEVKGIAGTPVEKRHMILSQVMCVRVSVLYL